MVDLAGGTLHCDLEVAPAALCVTSLGGTLRNGSIRIPAGAGITVDADCSLALEEIAIEAVGRGSESAVTDAPVAMLTLESRARVTVQTVRLEGAPDTACQVTAGAALIGSALVIQGAGGCALDVQGGTVDVLALHVANSSVLGIRCAQAGNISAPALRLTGTRDTGLVLEGRSTATLTGAVLECSDFGTGVCLGGACKAHMQRHCCVWQYPGSWHSSLGGRLQADCALLSLQSLGLRNAHRDWGSAGRRDVHGIWVRDVRR